MKDKDFDPDLRARLTRLQAELKAAEIDSELIGPQDAPTDVWGEIQGWRLKPCQKPGSWSIDKPVCDFWAAVVQWSMQTEGTVLRGPSGELGLIVIGPNNLWRFSRLAQAFPRVDCMAVSLTKKPADSANGGSSWSEAANATEAATLPT